MRLIQLLAWSVRLKLTRYNITARIWLFRRLIGIGTKLVLLGEWIRPK